MTISIKHIKPGYTFNTNSGGVVRVLAVYNYNNIKVQHDDEFGYIHHVNLANLNRGEVKNPYQPSVHGVGYIGVGPHSSKLPNSRSHTKSYNIWVALLARTNGIDKGVHYPTYTNSTVCTEWHNFQNFAHWYTSHPDYDKGYELDKDLLYPGNRHYSPNTCCMIPKEINNLISSQQLGSSGLPRGVNRNGTNGYSATFRGKYLGTRSTISETTNLYNSAREAGIENIAELYKSRLQPNVYLALIRAAKYGYEHYV